MGDDRVANRDRFFSRIGKFYQEWNTGSDETLKKIDAFYFAVGGTQEIEEMSYPKSVALQSWLFSYEISDSLALFTKKGVYMLASKNKVNFMQPLASDEAIDGVPPVTCIVRDKTDKDQSNYNKLLDAIKESGEGKTVGTFEKDKFSSDFVTGWTSALEDAEIAKVDVAQSFSHILSVKEESEIALTKKAATISANVWNNYLRKEYVRIINEDKKVKHSRLAEDALNAMQDVKVIGGRGISNPKDTVEFCYTPIIQSGGNYSLKLSAESDNKFLHYGVIVSSLGARYRSYCSNVARTMMVNPKKHIVEAYETLLVAEMAVINALKPGAKLCDVYEAGVNAIKERDQALVDKLTKSNFGFSTGLEFKDSTLTIGPKCTEVVKTGMVFVVHMGLQKLDNDPKGDDRSKTAALLVSDTILVEESGCENLTAAAKSRAKSNTIQFQEDDEEEEPSNNSGESNKENRVKADDAATSTGRSGRRANVVMTDQTRNKETGEDKRRQTQKELAEKLNREAAARFADKHVEQDEKRTKKANISYKSLEKFPADVEISRLNIFVDRRHDSIILPIFGIPVPYHIAYIKNCSQSVEGDFTYLRINFTHPGGQIGSKDASMYPNPLATYLKEMTYRSSNLKEHGEVAAPSSNLVTAYRLIKEMQKKFKTQEAEEREKEGVVKQDKLVLSQNRGNPKLKDLYVWPNIIAKRISGTLEAHMNGFRYTSLRGDKIDVLFNNIKHAFFQPCAGEMIILLHFHLKYPVLWGKKKHTDVQFFTEVGETTTDLGKYHHMMDRDDMRSEQQEREMRTRLDNTFQSFCDKVARLTDGAVDFDAPYNELGFPGVPLRSACTLKPTATCLVSLSERPPFVVTLDEIELVHFERVSHALKNFDMVLIFKDYTRKTQMITQVPMTKLDSIKDWLNSCDIRYTEGLQSLNWQKIMKQIVDDPHGFFENGGWNFLNLDSDDEEGEDSDSSEAYTPSEDSDDEFSGSDEDEDEEEAEPTSESDAEASLGTDESSGKDWSDLEEEAKQADRAKEVGEEMDPSDRKRKDKEREREKMKRKHGHSSGGGSSSKHHHRHSSSGGGGGSSKKHHHSHHHSSSSKSPDKKRRRDK